MNLASFKRPSRNDTKLDYSTFVQMQEWLERLANCVYSSDFIVSDGSMRRVAIRSSTDMDYSYFAFGFSIKRNKVTVKAGYLFHGTRAAIVVAGSVVTIEADNTYIYVTYVFGDGSASITSSTTFPQHTATTLNWLLYKVTLTGGRASVEEGNIYHVGNIHIPGNFA